MGQCRSSRRAPVAWLFLSLILIGCEHQSPRALAELPVTLRGGRIFVQGTVNGTQSVWLAIDTAAAATVLSPRAGAGAGEGEVPEKSIHSPGTANIPVHALSNASVRLGNVELPLDAYSVPQHRFDLLNRRGTQPIDGLLGYDLFQRYVVRIDYQTARLSLFDPATFQYRGPGEQIPIQIEGGLAFTEVHLIPKTGQSPIQCRMVLDIAGRWSTLWRRCVSRNPSLSSLPVRSINATSWGPQRTEQLVSCSLLRIGQRTLISDAAVALSESDEWLWQPVLESSRAPLSHQDGLVGGLWMRHFKLIIDYPHRRLIMERALN